MIKNNKAKLLALLMTAFSCLPVGLAQAQSSLAVFKALPAIQPPADYDNIHVVPLSSDKHASEFLIYVRQAVKAHIHESHSETLYIIAGEGEMQVGEQTYIITVGSFLKVPEGVVHGVRVTSAEPLVALSIQAPEFKGKDRVFID